jgi:hypothetical protein
MLLESLFIMISGEYRRIKYFYEYLSPISNSKLRKKRAENDYRVDK